MIELKYKIQMIELLRIRGITKLEKGETVDSAIEASGGEQTLEEMVKVNEVAMEYFRKKYMEVKNENK